MSKLRTVAMFTAVLGVSFVGNVFANEAAIEQSAPVAQTEVTKDAVAKDTKEMKKVTHKQVKKMAKDKVEAAPAQTTEAPANK